MAVPGKATTRATISPSEYARRHVIFRLNSTNGLIVMVVASQANSEGSARTTQRYIAEDMNKSLASIERGMRWLLSEGSGPVLTKATGRRYVVNGYADHDPYECGHPECESDFTFRMAGERKRQAARDRQRKARAGKASQAA